MLSALLCKRLCAFCSVFPGRIPLRYFKLLPAFFQLAFSELPPIMLCRSCSLRKFKDPANLKYSSEVQLISAVYFLQGENMFSCDRTFCPYYNRQDSNSTVVWDR